MNKEKLAVIVVRAWSRATSADPVTWSPSNPAWGQCAVTALIVQDHLGGQLRRGLVNGVSHYWNQLPGEVLDLTFNQFDLPDTFDGHLNDSVERTREYVLGHEATARRYAELKHRVDFMLAGGSLD